MFGGHDLVVTGLRLSHRHSAPPASEKLAKGRNGLTEGRVGSDADRWKAASNPVVCTTLVVVFSLLEELAVTNLR